ncbi:MAG: YlxR family protein [Lachnospiraceae bacterium]|nr:YlxR family protein [Lachnospiraceae bacterium]MBP3507128.1 YlxR family protein [Lachnospiraceae bacterium]
MAKKPTLRQCIGCGQPMEKKSLIRVIRNPEGIIELDATGKKNGRGAYLCPSQECLAKAMKSKGLERSFQMQVPKEIYQQLSKELSELETQ